MISEQYATGNSVIHQLDPRVRVGFTILYVFAVALSYRFSVLLVALVISSVLILFGKINLIDVLKKIIWVNVLIFLLWLLLPFTFKGEVLARVGSLAVYRPGVILAAQITLKSNAILLAFIALIATMSFATLGHALYRMHVPEKIVHLLLMTYRYVFVIEQEYLRLMRAAKIRGFLPGTNRNTYRTYAYVVGMLFVRAASRAERVHQAMQCRGFKGKFYSLQGFQINAASWVFAIMMTAIIGGLIFMELSKTI